MEHIDGFQTTDSFRFDRQTFSSSISLSSSSGYGSGFHLFPVDHSSCTSNRLIGLTKYLKEKLSRPKSLSSLISSSRPVIDDQHPVEIYESVWNLDEQIDRIRSEIDRQISSDNQSIISMSVDQPSSTQYSIPNDQELLSAASWYQEGLPRHICEEYLHDQSQPIGSFFIRHSYTHPEYPFVLSVKTETSLVEHFLIEGTIDHHGYRLQVSHSFTHL